MLHTRPLFLLAFLLGSWSIATGQVIADFTANETTGCGSLQVSFSDQSTSTTGTITNWSWNLGGVSSSNQNPGRIFGTPGLYEICLTVTDDQGNSDTNCKTDYIQIFQNPTPLFSLSQFNGCSPLEVEFTDLSQSADGVITEWIWGLGGTTGVVVDDGALTDISSTYDLPGEYTVSLTIRDENNCVGSLTQSNLITVFPDPDIMVVADDTFGCDLPFIVNFTNLNSEPNVVYEWDFGNGETFIGPNPPTIEYLIAGSYDIQIIAQNSVTNCVDTLIKDDFIQVGLPGSFSFTPENGCQELTVDFMDNSEGTVDSILWDFGDGNTSTQIDPNHTYLNPGCYTPSLTRYISDCPTTLFASDCILVFSLPSANYSSDEPEACEIPHTVNFTNLSSNGLSYSWDFGDGNSSTEFSPSHTYTLFGEFPVTLIAEDVNGCTSTVVVDTIRVVETMAALAFDVLWGCTPLQVVLDESSNTVGDIVNWNWEVVFEDGTDIINSSQENPMLTLVDTGFYEVTLTVMNSLGCTSTATFEKALGVGIPPVVDFTATPLETCVNSPVNFTDLSSSYGDFWIWDFGDGTVVEDIQNPSHQYLDTGFFDVTLLVFNNGCGEVITFEDYIHVSSPIGKPNFMLDCVDPFTVDFTNVSIGADSVFWEFDVEGNTTDTTSNFIPMHTYPDTGCYFVAHTAFNFESGCIDYDTLQLCVTNPIADFQLAPTEGCAPLTVTAEDLSVFAISYQWIVNDGVVSDATVASPTIVFEEPGTYSDIRLVITDIHNCQDTFDYTDVINVNGVEADFTPVPMGGCFPLPVSFADNSTSLFGDIVQWEWVIGDTIFTTSEPNFIYTFDTIGIFPVSLTVTNEDGCTGTILEMEAVEVTLPIAEFSADTISCTADVVRFIDMSSGTDLTYLWDFGDNTTSTETDPVHNYTSQGAYTVCLTITDPYDCDSTICKVDYIQIANPIANFTVDSTSADCPELIVQFENQSINASSYEWNFGDDSGPSNLENPPHVYTLPGVFDVSLVAIATENCRDTAIIDDFILLDGPIGEFEFTIDTSCVPLRVGFAGMSDKLYDFIWDFGNGDLDSTLTVEMDTTNYIYTEVGAYVPKLILIDDSGCKVAYESPDTIYVEDLELNFIASDTILCNDLAMTNFINLSTSTAPITFTEWNLEGLDPPITNDSEPNIIYPDPGNFDVSLILANPYCRDTLLKENYITVGAAPVADFALSDTMGCTPVTVNFSDLSSISEGAIISWEWDFGDSTSANIRNPQHIYSVAGTYEINLTVSTAVGCTDVYTRMIEILSLPLVELSNSLIVCQGEVVELNAELMGDTTGLVYNWLPSPTLSCTDCLNPLASPLDTTTYYFTLASPNGCVDTNEVVVNVRPFPVPVVEISNDTLICANDNVQLIAGGGDNVFSYQWDPNRPGLTCYESCFNPVAFPASSTTYVVTVTNVHGCSAQDSVFVDVIDQAQPIAGPDRTICLGDSVQLQVDFGMDITWLNPTSLTCTYCPNPIASPPSDKGFRVSAITDIGCEIFDTITVFVLEPNDIDAGTDQVICVGDEIELEGSGIGLVSWSPEDDLDDPNVLNPFASPLFNTTYLMTVVNDLCVLMDSMILEVVEETTITANDVTICAGDTIQLSVDGSADFFNWLPPTNLSNSEVANPFAWPSETTTYEILGQLASCSQGTAEITVAVEPTPAVSLPTVHRFFPGQIVEMGTRILSEGNYQFTWSGTDSLSCTNCPNPFVAPDTNGIFNLIVTDLDNGCEVILETRLQILTNCPDDLLGVPNAFSPNEDNNNDLLKVITSIPQINTFKIFNRWGAVVFETKDKLEGWDGILDGATAPIGVYVYFVEAPCPVDPKKTIFKKGDVTLFR